MYEELIKLKVKKESSSGLFAKKIKDTFIKSCVSLDASIFEPLISENQYFQDLDKYRFLHSLQKEFNSWKEKGFTKTTMIKGTCNGCHLGHNSYQFYTNKLTPAFAYIIHEENDKIIDVFMCNLSSGMQVVDMSVLQHYNFYK